MQAIGYYNLGLGVGMVKKLVCWVGGAKKENYAFCFSGGKIRFLCLVWCWGGCCIEIA